VWKALLINSVASTLIRARSYQLGKWHTIGTQNEKGHRTGHPQLLIRLEPVEGFEPPTRSLQNCRSTPELHRPGCMDDLALLWGGTPILPNSLGKRQITEGTG
jgi:hypothetical protein